MSNDLKDVKAVPPKTRETFESEDKDGNKLELAVRKPSPQVLTDAQTIYSSTWGKLVDKGVKVRAKIIDVLKDQGIWDDDDEANLVALQKEILKLCTKLERGGLPLDEATALAFSIKEKRDEVYKLIIRRNSLDEVTAEAQAELARLNYIIYACTVYRSNNQRYFKSLDDYYDRLEEKVTADAATHTMKFLNSTDLLEIEQKQPENKFLRDWGLVDEKLRRINSDGHLVDSEGRLVNEDGYFVDKEGNLVNINGDPVDKEGNLNLESKPFLDKDGNPIYPPNHNKAV